MLSVSWGPLVTPTLTTVSPASGTQGNTVNATLTGTNFIVGATTVNVSGTGITVQNTSVSNATTLTVDFVLAADATVSARTVSVTTAGGTSGTQTFTVISSAYTQTFLQAAALTTDLTTYTFSAQNLGAADAARCIVAAIHSRATLTTAFTISSVTINAVSASIPLQISNTASNANVVGFAIAAVPTGTSGDVVVVLSRAGVRAAVALWSTTGLPCGESPNDTDSSTATNPSVLLNVPANGFALGACSIGGNSTTTWTGLAEDYDAVSESALNYTGAGDDFAVAQSNLTLTCDSGASNEPAGVFASWGPAAAPGPDPGGTPAGVIGGGVF